MSRVNTAFMCVLSAVFSSGLWGCGAGVASSPAKQSVAYPAANYGGAADSVSNAYVTADSAGMEEAAEGRVEVATTSTSGVASSSSGVPAGGATAPVAQAAAQPREQLVIEGWVHLEVEDPAAAAAGFREAVEKAGGRVINERISGAVSSGDASLQVRVPPQGVASIMGWLEQNGDITHKNVSATDVSKQLVDQEIRLTNLRVTLERLRKLLETGGLNMQDILAVERELTRLRGEIERIAGEKRWLEDRVAYATLTVNMNRRGGVVLRARSKFYPGPKLSALTLFDPGDRKGTRLGTGAVVHLFHPRLSLEFEIFNDVDATATQPREKHAVLATFGAAAYSDHFGGGKRPFGNPFLGLRLGYGYLDYSAFVVQGEVGVEIFKHEYVLVDAAVRATAFLNEDNVDAGLVSSLSAVIAF